MDKRHLVFVSSTYQDLTEERAAVMQALLADDCIPTGMEMFPASDGTAWEVIERVISECDYFVLVLGGRYGSADGGGLGFTEREYDYAVERGIPVLAFVHEDPEQIEGHKLERSEAGQVRLKKFRDKVMQRHCKKWRVAEGLAGQVALAISHARKTHPRPGWIKANQVGSPEKLNQLRSRIEELEGDLERSRATPPPGAEGLASGDEEFCVRISTEVVKYGTRAVSLTWNDIIRIVGGTIRFGACDDSGIHRALADFAAEGQTIGGNRAFIADEDMRTVKGQMVALGLMEKAGRDSDWDQSVWRLTPYGERYVMRVLAVPSGKAT